MSALAGAWVAETLLASSLLMVVVAILRLPVARMAGSHIAYLLWALPALRMITPPLPAPSATVAPAAIDVSDFVAAAAPVADAPSFNMISLIAPSLMIIWIAGASLHFIWGVASYHRFLRRALALSTPVASRSGVTIYTADVAGPVATGVIRRRILLPVDFSSRFEPCEQDMALAHELAHHRRGDLLVNWLALIVLSLHWFNPIAHLAYRRFRSDQEMACDATVLATAPAGQAEAYGCAILKAVWDRRSVAACALNNAEQIKSRLRMMKFHQVSLIRTVSGVFLAGVVATGALAMTASRTLPHAEPAKTPAPVMAPRGISGGKILSIATDPIAPAIQQRVERIAQPVKAPGESIESADVGSLGKMEARTPPDPEERGERAGTPAPERLPRVAGVAAWRGDGAGPDLSPADVRKAIEARLAVIKRRVADLTDQISVGPIVGHDVDYEPPAWQTREAFRMAEAHLLRLRTEREALLTEESQLRQQLVALSYPDPRERIF
jgi:beta-lactamase regulating signal transducer with metallopeptidase domain